MASHGKQNVITLTMLIGIVLGGVAGYYIPSGMLAIDFIGTLFVNALKLVLLPLVVSTVIIGVALLGNFQKLGRAAVSTVLYFAGTTIVAVAVGVVLASAIAPGLYSSQIGVFIPDMVTKARTTEIADLYLALIPSNLIRSIVEGQLLGLIVFSLFFGGALAVIGKRAKPVIDFFTVVSEVSIKMVRLVMYAAPVGLFILVGSAVAGNPKSLVAISGNFAYLGITVLLGIFIHGVIVLPLILKLAGHRSPWQYVKNVCQSLLTALGTASSVATAPVLYTEVVEKNNIDQRAGSMVIPLGATMNLNGTAMYLAIASIFIAQLFGLNLSVMDMILIAALSTVISLGAGGVPGTSLFMLAILFGTAGFPLEAYAGIGLLVTVDWLFDRGRTVLNVWGDAVGAAVIGESFEFKTAKVTHRTSTTTRPVSTTRRYRPSESATGKPKRAERKTKTANGKYEKKSRNGYSTERRPSRKKQSTERVKTNGTKSTTTKSTVDKRKTPPAKSLETKTQSVKEEKPSSPSPFQSLTPPPLPVVPDTLPSKEEPSQSKTSISPEHNKETTSDEQMTRTDIVHERAHLASQIASVKQDEERKRIDSPVSPPEEPIRAKSFEPDSNTTHVDQTGEYEQNSDNEPKYDNNEPEETKEETDVSPPDVDTMTTNAPEEEPLPSNIEYGRGRIRKGVQKTKSSSSEPKADEKVKTIDSYSTEHITFGRQKRKRIR